MNVIQAPLMLQVSSDPQFRVEYFPGEKYRYVLTADWGVPTDWKIPSPVGNEFVQIGPSGLLWMRKGYAWDGASGPAINTVNFVRGSCGHDAAYQLIKEGHLPMEFRKLADELLYKLVLQDKMWKIRAAWVYLGVRVGGRLYMKMNKA